MCDNIVVIAKFNSYRIKNFIEQYIFIDAKNAETETKLMQFYRPFFSDYFFR